MLTPQIIMETMLKYVIFGKGEGLCTVTTNLTQVFKST